METLNIILRHILPAETAQVQQYGLTESFLHSVHTMLAGTGLSASLITPAVYVLATLCVLLAAWLSFYVCHRLLVPLTVIITKKTDVMWDDIIFNEKTLRAASLIVPSVLVWTLLPPVFRSAPGVAPTLERVAAVLIVLASLRLAITVVDSFKQFEGESRTDVQQYFHTFCGVLKIILISVALIIATSVAIGKSPVRLLAGLGATSAVLMLVFKDVVSNLVAGIRLTSNNMLHKGDWITVAGTAANGFVEDMTLSTVKVRNFDNTIVTVSPRTLVDGSFQNWAGMWNSGGRRVARRVVIDFRSIAIADTGLKRSLADKGYLKPEEMQGDVVNLTLFRRYAERWIARRDDVNDSLLFMVRQLEPSDTGLPLEFYFFLKQKQWKPYEHHMAEVMEHFYALLPRFGLRVYQRISDGKNQ